MLNVAVTFDYEMFFGENFADAEEILFLPTELLLDILKKHNVKATFFVDVLSVYMHEKMGLLSYCENFIRQIKKMVQLGHDVQLHLHTNWLTAEYLDGKWVFHPENYNIHSYGFDKNDSISAYNIIRWGKEFLESNLRQVDESYNCIAFRAGGYCIQPHEKLFEALNENGIWIDSSVAVQQKKDNINIYDYTDIPPMRNAWWVKNTADLKKMFSKVDGNVYEVPVICTSRSLITRLLHPETEKTLRCGKPKGTYIGQSDVASDRNKFLNKLKALLCYNKAKPMLTYDSLRYGALHRALFQRAKFAKGEEYVSLIGHPKLIDTIWLDNFDRFLSGINNNAFCCFVTMTQIGYSVRQ